jgi:hypothetical protein
MGLKFNPFSGNFDFTGSGGGGGGSAFFAGEVATYADLPLDGTAALDSRWLVRSNSGTWPFSSYKQAGVYVRKAIVGASRENDYQLTDTSFHDVMSDAAFVIYDDGAPTRSMQVEITDNETLTFKVTGTDSVVRSVAFALSAIILAALMASSALAQNIGLVTDTNGNVVTRRTNVLSFTNNLRFAPLTNANSRTALIGTNGALSAGNPPSGAAANGALLTADGAGSSSFVASRTVTKFTTNDQTKTNWGFNAVTQSTNNDPQMGSWSLDANSFYRVEYAVAWVATTNSGFAHGLGFSTNLSEFNHRTGVGQAANTTVTAINAGTNATTIALANASAAATGGRFAVAGFVYVLTSSNANTMNYRWYPINNSADATTLIQSSMVSVTKMSP